MVCVLHSHRESAYFHWGCTELPKETENIISIMNAILLIKTDKTHEAFSLNIACCGVISFIV